MADAVAYRTARSARRPLMNGSKPTPVQARVSPTGTSCEGESGASGRSPFKPGRGAEEAGLRTRCPVVTCGFAARATDWRLHRGRRWCKRDRRPGRPRAGLRRCRRRVAERWRRVDRGRWDCGIADMDLETGLPVDEPARVRRLRFGVPALPPRFTTDGTQGRIMLAGLGVFPERGFRGTSIRDIAAKQSFSPPRCTLISRRKKRSSPSWSRPAARSLWCDNDVSGSRW